MGSVLVLALLLWQQPDPAAEGMKALEEQRWDAAAASFTRAIEKDPKDYSHHFHLGLALSMLRRDEEAISHYRKVLELKPELPPAEINLGTLLLRQKRASEALPHLESAAKAAPKNARAHLLLGEAQLAMQDAAKAQASFATALELDAKSAAAEVGLARALVAQKRPSEAAEHFRKAAELDPSYGEAVLELAQLYEEQKQFAEAIAIYRKFPDSPAARERVGELLLESGQAAESIPHLEAAAAASPTSANRYALATAYIASGAPAKAAPLLAQAVAAEPGNVELRMMYGRVLREQKQFTAAAAEFYKSAQLQPSSAEAWSDLAGMLILTEKYQQAMAALDRVRQLGAEKAAHHYFRALVLDKFRQLAPALESYQQFLALSEGKNPDEEFKARQRVRILQKELNK